MFHLVERARKENKQSINLGLGTNPGEHSLKTNEAQNFLGTAVVGAESKGRMLLRDDHGYAAGLRLSHPIKSDP